MAKKREAEQKALKDNKEKDKIASRFKRAGLAKQSSMEFAKAIMDDAD